MRSAEKTPEPFGSKNASRPHFFVVQKHAARQLHYDFRLEWGGTLVSWAVPKGPSPNPEDKRFAAHVEDHPVEYGDFEGIIPAGNYGAGNVIVWDRGRWVPLDEPDQGLAEGKLHFELHGHKLRGIWLLIQINKKAGGKEWLLRKKPDNWTSTEENPFPEESVLSGLLVEELDQSSKKTVALRKKLKRKKVPEGTVDPFKAKLMLAKTADGPFSDPEWLFELKYDGYRVLASRDTEGEPSLRSRNGHNITEVFPDIALSLKHLPFNNLVLDGELVVLNETSQPDFGLLQKRAKLHRRRDIERASVELPACLFVFDVLAAEGHDFRTLPLLERKKWLPEILPPIGPLRYTDHYVEHGEIMFEKVTELGFEGVMAKRADSPYKGLRSPQWLKIPADKTGDFVVCGFSAGQGSRVGVGALHLGAYKGGKLTYVGRVGTGFSDQQLSEFYEVLKPKRVKSPLCVGVTPKSGKHTWVQPEYVVEVRYKILTRSGNLRMPVYLRTRDDKTPEDCVLDGGEIIEAPEIAEGGDEAETEVSQPQIIEEKIVHYSNQDKVFWPKEGYTKGDLVEYYRKIYPYLAPYLKDRPLVLTRYPDGIEGKSFYQKNVPDFLPSWIRTETVWSEGSQKDIRYLVCDDEESLMYIINMGSIPLHLWSSRVDNLAHPDWCILDLDPKGAPFKDVITLAKAIRKLCDEIGLSCYVKTTGSTGLHILVPLGGICTYEQSRMLGHLIARVIESRHGKISTTARSIPARKGRVYLDYLQNRHGQLLVSPYCVRPLETAPVSAPLEWREVTSKLHPQKFNIKNLPTRLKRKKSDPMTPVLTEKPDLVGALGKLSEFLEDAG